MSSQEPHTDKEVELQKTEEDEEKRTQKDRTELSAKPNDTRTERMLANTSARSIFSSNGGAVEEVKLQAPCNRCCPPFLGAALYLGDPDSENLSRNLKEG